MKSSCAVCGNDERSMNKRRESLLQNFPPIHENFLVAATVFCYFHQEHIIIIESILCVFILLLEPALHMLRLFC